MNAAPEPASLKGQRFTIRQKVVRLLGAAFFLYDEAGLEIGYCKQKAFRFREDLRLYTDRSRTKELFALKARSIIDFSATYDILTPDGTMHGSVRRSGLSSMVRDTWQVHDAHGNQICKLSEDSTGSALARRLIPLYAVFSPQRFDLTDLRGAVVASFQTRFNPLVYKLDIAIHDDSPELDLYMVLAVGILIAAIEGRQGNSDSGSGLFSGG